MTGKMANAGRSSVIYLRKNLQNVKSKNLLSAGKYTREGRP